MEQTQQRRTTAYRYRLVHTLILALCFSAALPLAAEPDHTTYIIRTRLDDLGTLQSIEAAGGVIDHFDGHGTRAYILREHWGTFLATGIPHEIEAIQPPAQKEFTTYPSYDELSTRLNNFATTYPEICALQSLGRSVQGRELWALKITDNPGSEEDEPEFAYLSTTHGDETIGTILCLNFIEWLLTGYGEDSGVTALVNDTEIWIVPLLNPDGYEMGLRWNANNIDLNRAFPAWPNEYNDTLGSNRMPATAGREPEVAHIMDWTAANSFVLSANYHAGALVVNYPYDEIPGIPSGQDAPTPDDDLMRYISQTYANQNPPMLASIYFANGISNGSAWYRISGGMQDWNYRFAGAIDLTLEVSTIKNPNPNALSGLWNDNRLAMRDYLSLVHRGVRGLVTDKTTDAPLPATITIDDNPQPVFSDPDVGDFHRLLLPGTYNVRADAPGYIPYTAMDVTVTEGSAVRVDFQLSNGDVNGDGQVDAVDLQLVVNTILGSADIPAADVDGGGVSATDLQHLVNRALGRL